MKARVYVRRQMLESSPKAARGQSVRGGETLDIGMINKLGGGGAGLVPAWGRTRSYIFISCLDFVELRRTRGRAVGSFDRGKKGERVRS